VLKLTIAPVAEASGWTEVNLTNCWTGLRPPLRQQHPYLRHWHAIARNQTLKTLTIVMDGATKTAEKNHG
jgi:hypothetical protein